MSVPSVVKHLRTGFIIPQNLSVMIMYYEASGEIKWYQMVKELYKAL